MTNKLRCSLMMKIELNSVAFETTFNRPLPQAVPTALDAGSMTNKLRCSLMMKIELNSGSRAITFNRPLPQAVPTALDKWTLEQVRTACGSGRLDATRPPSLNNTMSRSLMIKLEVRSQARRKQLNPPATAGGSDGFGRVDS